MDAREAGSSRRRRARRGAALAAAALAVTAPPAAAQDPHARDAKHRVVAPPPPAPPTYPRGTLYGGPYWAYPYYSYPPPPYAPVPVVPLPPEDGLAPGFEVIPAGRVHLLVDPVTALVSIDGRELTQRDDLSYEVGLLEGVHHLEIRAQGHRPLQREIDVRGGQYHSLTIRLEPAD